MTAAPLAMLMSGDVLDLGLGIAVSVESGCGRLLSLLEALASVRLHDVAFQVRPRPRVNMCFAANEVVEDSALVSLTSDRIGFGSVLASFSLWVAKQAAETELPSSGTSDAVSGGLLFERYLQPALPADVARSGVGYESCLGTVPVGFTWHICASEETEAAMYRRAAGDFDGRAVGDFEWQGDEDGPEARLWQLATELAPSADGDQGRGEMVVEQRSIRSSSLVDANSSPRNVTGLPSPRIADVPDAEASGSYDESFHSEESG